jgi:hypothetical protein
MRKPHRATQNTAQHNTRQGTVKRLTQLSGDEIGSGCTAEIDGGQSGELEGAVEVALEILLEVILLGVYGVCVWVSEKVWVRDFDAHHEWRYDALSTG